LSEVKLGKISKVRLGAGGYDDAMFGLSLTFSFGDSTGCGDFIGFWTTYPEHAKYSREHWEACHKDTMLRLIRLMHEAKVGDVSQLKGVPIEATFDGMKLVDWRILSEVL
jgi:hypothetical protein